MMLSRVKLYLPIIVTVLFFTSLLNDCYAQSTPTTLTDNLSKFKLLLDDNLTLYVSLPTDWKIDKGSLLDNVADAIIIIPPKNMPSFMHSSKLTIGIERLNSEIHLSDYSKSAIDTLASRLIDFEIVDIFPINISDLSGERIIFTHKVDDKTIKVLQTWLIDNKIAFILTFATTPGSFGYYNPTLNEIISSITISNNSNYNNLDEPLAKISNYTLFKSPYGFELNYPNDWILSEGVNRLSFISNQFDSSDLYLERLDIYYNLSNSNILFSNSSQTEDEIMRTGLLTEINYLVDNLQNLNIISISNVNFNSIKGKELLYSYDSNIGKTKVSEYLLNGNKLFVILSFSTSYIDFEKMSNTMMSILKSFKFLSH